MRMEDYIVYIARFIVLLFILPAHEFAHALAAYKNGDYTAKFSGRYTLNPLKHFDPIGLVCFLIAGFGWAKPVPVNPYNFKDYKKGSFWVSVAGVVANYFLAFIFYPLFILCSYFLGRYNNFFSQLIIMIMYCGFVLDLNFCVFNLIPVFPLDGFRLIDTFVKKRGKVYAFLRQYGYYALLGLVLLSSLSRTNSSLSFLNVFGYCMNFATDFFGYPITAFWNFIFTLIFG